MLYKTPAWITLLLALLVFNAWAGGYSSPTSSYISDNQRLSYHALGNGAHTVLILGGGPGFSSWNLTPLQQHLSQNYRVLLMDMRGIGENRDANYQIDQLLAQWVDDIEALRRYEQAGQFILVGHSWGALMAQVYARHHPTRIARLVLLNPVDPDLQALRPLIDRIDQRLRQAGLVDQTDPWDIPLTQDATDLAQQQLNRVVPTYFFDIEQGKAYAKQFTPNDLSLEINHAIWPQYRQNPIQANELQTLAKRRAIELITCREDLLMPQALQGYQTLLPNISYQNLTDCAHFPWEEVPHAFYPALDRAITADPPEDDFSDLSDADRAWLMDDSGLDELVRALDAVQTEARFLTPFDLTEHYSMTNQIELSPESLQTGWADLIQCHTNLDPVGQLQIVYHAEHTRDLEILSQQGIEFAWVDGTSVQMRGLVKGAQLCIHAQTRALQKTEGGYLIQRGPFMRKFLDGYFPMHVELSIDWPKLNLKLNKILPDSQPGLVIKQQANQLNINYYFQGQLKPQLFFSE